MDRFSQVNWRRVRRFIRGSGIHGRADVQRFSEAFVLGESRQSLQELGMLKRTPKPKWEHDPYLGPCPCGGTAVLERPMMLGAEVRCQSCGLKVCRGVVNNRTLDWCVEEVASVWNRASNAVWPNKIKTKLTRQMACKKTPAGPTRTLISGEVVPEQSQSEKMTVDSKCPQKWLFVDLETGDVWMNRARTQKRGPGCFIHADEAALQGLATIQARVKAQLQCPVHT